MGASLPRMRGSVRPNQLQLNSASRVLGQWASGASLRGPVGGGMRLRGGVAGPRIGQPSRGRPRGFMVSLRPQPRGFPVPRPRGALRAIRTRPPSLVSSVHSNRLTGIIQNHYPAEAAVIVDIDDDDEDDIIVPSLPSSMKSYQNHPRPDLDIVTDEEVNDYGEYIEDEYEENGGFVPHVYDID